MAVIRTEAQYNALVRKLKAGEFKDDPETEQELAEAALYYSQRPIINRVQKVTREEGQSYFDKPKLSWDITRGQHPSEDTKLQRGAAVGVGGFIEGVADTADLAGTVVTAPLWAGHKLASKAGLAEDPGAYFGDEGYLDLSGAVTKAVNDSLEGSVEMEGEASVRNFARVGGAVASSLGVGAAMAGAGRGTPESAALLARGTRRLGTMLAESPKIQAAGAFSGEAARQFAESQGAGVGWQIAASIAGGMAPGVATAGVRRAVTKATAIDEIEGALDDITVINNMGEKIAGHMEKNKNYADAMEEAGLLVSDYATGKKGKYAGRVAVTKPGGMWEGVLRKTPGSAGRIAKVADNVERRIQKILEAEVRGLGEGGMGAGFAGGRAGAGETVEKSIAKLRVAQKQQAASAYKNLNNEVNRVIENVPFETRGAEAMMTRAYFNSLEEGGQFSDILNSPTLRSLATAFRNVEKAGFDIEYSDLKNLRMAIGRKLGNPTLLDDAPRAELRRLYGKVSQDIREHLDQIDPSGRLSKMAAETDAMYAKQIDVIDRQLQKFVQKIDSKASNTEDVATTLWQQARSDAGTQRLDDLLKEAFDGDRTGDWREVQSFLIERMMRTSPANPKQFDLVEFARQWDSIPAANKDIIFGAEGDVRKLMDSIGRTARRAASRAKAKPLAGTIGPGAVANLTGIGAAGAGIATQGLLAPVAILGGVVGGANMLARGMTSPTFARWLVKSKDKKFAANNLSAVLPGLVEAVRKDPTIGDLATDLLNGLGLMGEIEQDNEDVEGVVNKYLGAD